MALAAYNEIDPAAAHVLRQQIDDGVIAPGVVITKSIKELTPDDLRGFTQVHLFAGGGLWSVAARLAGWPDDRPLWTGSCPCQPFSAAGKGGGTDDPRHLWPDFLRLIRGAGAAGFGPPVVMGEQVSGAAGYGWFDGVRADLEEEGYASRARDFPACSVDAPHQRNRLYWVAVEQPESIGWRSRRAEHEVFRGRPAVAGATVSGVTLGDAFGSRLEGQRWHGDGSGRPEQGRSVAPADGAERFDMADSLGNERGCGRPGDARGPSTAGKGTNRENSWTESSHAYGIGESLHADADSGGRAGWQEGAERGSLVGAAAERHPLRNGTYWSDAEWITCHDGKARRAKSGLRFLVDGLPGRVDLWRVGGNAIVPQAAAEVIRAFMDVYDAPQRRAA